MDIEAWALRGKKLGNRALGLKRVSECIAYSTRAGVNTDAHIIRVDKGREWRSGIHDIIGCKNAFPAHGAPARSDTLHEAPRYVVHGSSWACSDKLGLPSHYK